MKPLTISSALFAASCASATAIERRQSGGGGFEDGQPIDGNGKGAPILGMRLLAILIDRVDSVSAVLTSDSLCALQAVRITRSIYRTPTTSGARAPTVA